MLSNAVTIVAGSGTPGFHAQLLLPAAYRTGRPFSGAIQYGNSGSADMAAPLLILSGGGVAALSLFSTNAPATNDLLLLAASLQGPAGLLRIGQSWTLPFSAVSTLNQTIPFGLSYETADATDAVNYATLGASVRPAGYSDGEWNLAWAALQAQAGPHWGGLVSLLDHYATSLAEQDPNAQAGRIFYSEPDVLNYALGQLLGQAQSSLTGTLYLDSTNQPLAGVSLYLNGGGAGNTNQGGQAISSAQGSFAFLTLTNGEYALNVPGYWLPNPVVISLTNGGLAPLNLVVQAGGTLTGTIRNQSGTLFLSNITVSAQSIGDNGTFSTVSGADGGYRLSGLAPDTYYVSAGGPPYASLPGQYLTVSSGQIVNLNLYLSMGGTLSGQAVDGATEAPLGSATIVLTDSNGNQTGARADTNGNVWAAGLAPDTYTVQVEAPGYAPWSTTTNLSAGALAALGRIPLNAGATLALTLRDTTGASLTNDPITLSQGGVSIAQLLSDYHGSAIFPDLAAGTYQVQADAYGYQAYTYTLALPAGQGSTNILVLTLLGSISGTVSDGSGGPIPGLDVNLYGADPSVAGITLGVTTDPQGNYQLLGLPAGSYLVSVGNGNGIDVQAVIMPSSLAPQRADFTLKGTLVQGQVVAADAITPVSGASVVLRQGTQLLATAQSNTNGTYRFRVLVPGNYELAAGTQEEGITAGTSIAVPTGGSLNAPALQLGSLQLSGGITDGAGNGLSNALVALFLPGGAAAPVIPATTSDQQGQFIFPGLVAGHYLLEAQLPGTALLQWPVELSGSTNLALVLGPGSTVSGRITDALSGLGVSNALVGFFDPSNHFLVALTNSDSFGNYSIPALAAGNYDLLISETNHQVQELADISISPTPPAINASLKAKDTLLKGRATDAGGNPVAEAYLQIVDGAGEAPVILTTGPDGSWSANQLTGGSYSIAIIAPGYTPQSPGPIQVVPGATQTLNLTLTAVATDDSDPSLYNTLELAIAEGTLLAPCNPPLQLSFMDVPQPQCPCAYNASLAERAAFFQAQFRANTAQETWQAAYNNGAAVVGADEGVDAIKFAQILTSLMAAYGPYGTAKSALDEIKTLSRTGKAIVTDCALIKAAADIGNATDSALQAYGNYSAHPGTSSAVAAFTAFQTYLTKAGITGESLAKLAATMQEGEKTWSPGSSSQAGKLKTLLDIVDLTAKALKTYEDWHKSLGDCQRAGDQLPGRIAELPRRLAQPRVRHGQGQRQLRQLQHQRWAAAPTAPAARAACPHPRLPGPRTATAGKLARSQREVHHRLGAATMGDARRSHSIYGALRERHQRQPSGPDRHDNRFTLNQPRLVHGSAAGHRLQQREPADPARHSIAEHSSRRRHRSQPGASQRRAQSNQRPAELDPAIDRPGHRPTGHRPTGRVPAAKQRPGPGTGLCKLHRPLQAGTGHRRADPEHGQHRL